MWISRSFASFQYSLKVVLQKGVKAHAFHLSSFIPLNGVLLRFQFAMGNWAQKKSIAAVFTTFFSTVWRDKRADRFIPDVKNPIPGPEPLKEARVQWISTFSRKTSWKWMRHDAWLSFFREETKPKEATHHYEAKVQISWNENEFFSEMWMKKSWGNGWRALKRTWREPELMDNSLLIRVESKRIFETQYKFFFLFISLFPLVVSGFVLLPAEFRSSDGKSAALRA